MKPSEVNFTYTNNTLELCRVQGEVGWIIVVGDPRAISYEWVITDEIGHVTKKSDCGYGTVGIAMRDGLVVEFGLPDDLIHIQTVEPN